MAPVNTNTVVSSISKLVLAHPVWVAIFTLTCYAAFKILPKVLFRPPSIYEGYPGPARESFLLGNRFCKKNGSALPTPGKQSSSKSDPGMMWYNLIKEAGQDTIIYPDVLGSEFIVTRDPTFINHVLADSYGYQRDTAATQATKMLIGEGLVANFGDAHKKQRKMLGPAFSVDYLRNLMPVFFKSSKKMMEALEGDFDLEPLYGYGTKDALLWFGRVTLDIIGLAGFDYDFQAVEQGPNGVAVRDSFQAAMTASMNVKPLDAIVATILFFVLPSFHFLPLTETVRKIREMRDQLIKTSNKIVQEKSEELQREMREGGGSTNVDDMLKRKKDILHLCMKANMSSGVKESDKMSDKELAGQIVTFIFAGHETTATTLAWALQYLAQHQEVQDELRSSLEETLASMGKEFGDELDWYELHDQGFKLLDHVILETLRLRPPVTITYRTAFKDDMIPLSSPITLSNGKQIHQIPVKAGQNIGLSITASNLSSKLFGPSPETFNPRRWSELPEAHSEAKLPSPYGSFVFNAGPKVCIGSKFGLVEMKILLLLVLGKYKVEPVGGITIKSVEAVVQRPVVVGREEEGSKLPIKMVRI
ncbi:cytochrome P450 [Violaceomyces palustris]|uniref:Cytochrome P450 n=1 Tax=Violaceomyces palustris TaxID=1673888 RepID=A0ACD0NX56_9BASI|nr:cytochrome P450 [Violaceomyces palustris]